MHLILTILKVLGIVLLILLLLVLAVLLCLLFVPVRYRIRAEMFGKPVAHIKVTWLMHLITATVDYGENGLVYQVKALFFTLAPSKTKPPEEPFAMAGQEKPLQGDTTMQDSSVDDTGSERAKTQEDQQQEHLQGNEAFSDDDDSHTGGFIGESDDEPGNQSDDESDNIEAADKSKIRFWDKITAFADSIRNAGNRAEALGQKIREKYLALKEQLTDAENKALLTLLTGQAKELLLHIVPRRYDIKIRFGAASPDTTGYVTGLLSVVMAYVTSRKWRARRNRFEYTPVFDEKVLEGSVMMSGRIFVCKLLIIFIKVYFNQQFQKKILKK